MVSVAISVPVLMFVPAQPANQMEVLTAQVDRLMEVGVPAEVHVEAGKYKDEAMKLAEGFVFSVEMATIRLDRILLVDYRVSDRFLMEAGGVVEWTNPDKFTYFDGVVVPDVLCGIQGQLGPKYREKAPRDVRVNHDRAEDLGIPLEGLFAFNYWGLELLRECYMDFPGAVSGRGYVPCLSLSGGEPALRGGSDGADPSFGSVSVSRGSIRV